MTETDIMHVNEELTIRGLWAILRRRKNIIGIIVATFVVVAALVCAFSTREYQATGEIQVGKTSSDGLGLDSMISAAGDGASDALEANIIIQTQATILQSDTLALKVIQDLNLENQYDFRPVFNPIGWVLGAISPKGRQDPPGVALADAPGRRTRALKIFGKHLKVKPVAGTRLIDVSYTSSDPEVAAKVVNELNKELVQYTFQTRYDATNQASEWLAGQLSDVKREAESLQARVVELQRDSGVYSLGATDVTGHEMAYSSTLDRLQQATQALTAAESATIIKGDLYQMVKGKDPELISGLAGTALATSASPGISTSLTLLQNLRAQQNTLQAQLATDTSKYGSANPRLADERASLASMNQAIQDEASRIGERAKNDYEIASLTERDLRNAYNRQKLEANKLNDKAIEYTIARQEAVDGRQLYETLFQRLKEAGVMEGLQSTNITVVNPGRVPSKPTKPNVPMYLAGSIFLGLFFGSAGALFAESVDDKLHSIEMVEQELQIPLFGVLPRLDFSGGRYLLPKPMKLAVNKNEGRVPQLAVIESPAAAFAEALRCMRTTLQLSRRGTPPKVILVTSSVPGEGKSTVSSNLGALLAQSGERVLLVEGDMRRPSFARLLQHTTPQDNGLSGLLSGTQEQAVFHGADGIAGLRVLFAGPVPPFPSELLAANSMRDLIEALKPQFDRIIIDSPPLLAVTDALILSQFADITVLIARHEMTRRRSLKRAYKMLADEVGAHVGVVLNGVDQRSMSYDEYYGYAAGTYQTQEAVH